ncbi:MAG: tryptophan 2,3-dioxygenase family protein [Balneolaceae bacterium]|nr:tryptophan 2,3-dioxygenase family protein [Balneolaceae bacterium]
MPERVNENGLLYEPSEKNQQQLIEIMKNDPETAMLCELFVDFDEGMQEWRYRHVKMVERTIGNKMGTGGSDGVSYLRSTLHQRIFPDLWEIRSEI